MINLLALNVGPNSEPDFEAYLYAVEIKRLLAMDVLSPEYWSVRSALLNKLGINRPDLLRQYFQFNFSRTGDNF